MKLKVFLKKYRIENNLTQQEFAHKIGITQCLYSKLENGIADNIAFQTVRKLSVALDIDEKKIRRMYEDNK